MQANLKRWTTKIPDISAVMARFPVAVIAMAICTVLYILYNAGFNNETEQVARLCLGLIIGAYTSVSLTLSAEGRGKSRNIIVHVIAALIIAMLAWFSKELLLNLPMAIGAVILALGNAVRWQRTRNDLHVWDFTHKLWTGVVFTVAGSVIFLWGLLAIMAALKSLFGINIETLMMDFLLPIGFGFFAPLYWLSTLPPANEPYQELHDNPGFVSKAVAFMGTWLLAPLTLIYALILLAYGIKIGLARALPNGEVAQLTLPFLIIGTLTWLVLEPPFIKTKALAKLFRSAWWPLSIPASVLLGIAVFVRIAEYGYTPERFALLIGILWALGLGLWFTVGPKQKRDIRLIPGSAAVMLLVGTFSAGWLSQASQTTRFEAGLKAAGIMAADGTVASPIAISDENAARRAKGALEYLVGNNGKGAVLKLAKGAGIGISDTDGSEKITHAFGLDKVNLPNRWSRQKEITMRANYNALSIAGYDYLRLPSYTIVFQEKERVLFEDNTVTIKSKAEGMSIVLKNGEVFNFDAISWIDEQNFDFGEVKVDNPTVILLDDGDRKITIAIRSFSRWTVGANPRFNMELSLLTKGLEP